MINFVQEEKKGVYNKAIIGKSLTSIHKLMKEMILKDVYEEKPIIVFSSDNNLINDLLQSCNSKDISLIDTCVSDFKLNLFKLKNLGDLNDDSLLHDNVIDFIEITKALFGINYMLIGPRMYNFYYVCIKILSFERGNEISYKDVITFMKGLDKKQITAKYSHIFENTPCMLPEFFDVVNSDFYNDFIKKINEILYDIDSNKTLNNLLGTISSNTLDFNKKIVIIKMPEEIVSFKILEIFFIKELRNIIYGRYNKRQEIGLSFIYLDSFNKHNYNLFSKFFSETEWYKIGYIITSHEKLHRNCYDNISNIIVGYDSESLFDDFILSTDQINNIKKLVPSQFYLLKGK